MNKVEWADCDKCPLKNQPIVHSCGPRNAELVVVGEAPGKTEVQKGEPFVGMAGQLLNATLNIIGFDRSDVFYTNAVLCWPENNETPPETAVKACQIRLINELSAIRPKSVLATGKTAAEALLNKPVQILAQRGTQHKLGWLPKSPLTLTVHPAFVLRQPKYQREFRRDVEQAASGIVVDQIDIVRYVNISTLKALSDLLVNINGPIVTYDLETEGLDPHINSKILCLVLTEKPGISYVVDDAVLLNPAARRLLNKFFARTDLRFWGTNLKFDNKYLRVNNIVPPAYYDDTMLLHYVGDERRGTHGLKEMGHEYLKVGNWEEGLNAYIKPAKSKKTLQPTLLPSGVVVQRTEFERHAYGVIPKDVLYPYAARDTDINWRLIEPLKKDVHKKGWWLYNNILMPASRMFERSEHRGMLINRPLLDQAMADYTIEQANLLVELRKLCGKPNFNPASPKQLANVLYEDMKLPILGYTDKKAPSTAAHIIDRLIEDNPENEFLTQLLLHRAVSKILGTYLTKILFSLDKNSRTHASIMIHGTVTGRFVEKMWLLLPRPTKNKYAAVVRSLVMADPGYVILAPDYDQAELRVVTCEAEEPIYHKVFTEGGDPHATTTDVIYGSEWRSLSDKAKRDERRTVGKITNFLVLYGGGAKKLARGAGCSVQKGQEILDTYYNTFTKVAGWIDDTQAQILDENIGYLENKFGRRRRFELITPDNVADAMREGPNFIIQSTANDINTMSAIEIDSKLTEICQVLTTYHDAIILQAPEKYVDEAQRLSVEIMQQIPAERYSTYVPFTVDCKVGPSWGEAK